MNKYFDLLQAKTYSPQEISQAALIVHPKHLERYNLVADQIAQVFESWSNFTGLKHPIVDQYGNEYRDSEWYYMAQRIQDPEIKKFIAFCSIGRGLSKKAAYKYKHLLDDNPHNRIDYMQNAIAEKFNNNLDLKENLIQTYPREIIEYTYRGDTFFGISHITQTWSNILGKLLMEYRDNK